MNKLNVEGNVPLARFGHSVTLVLKHKLLLFGGATGDTGKYSITDNTYLFDIPTCFWKKLQTTGTTPSPRAAHAACAIQTSQVVIYGGASGGGCFVSDDLFMLDLKDSIGVWNTVKVLGQTPKKRYGHSMVFCKPYLLVFGGNINSQSVNDCWALNVEKTPVSWIKVQTDDQVPCPRVYQAATACSLPSGKHMIILGGRSPEPDSVALNDAWMLSKKEHSWSWKRIRGKGEENLAGRFQHSVLFMEGMLMVVGGRVGAVGEKLSFDVFDFQAMQWLSFNCLQRFRHGSVIVDKFLYLYGGFDITQTNKPADSVIRISLEKLFQLNETLLRRLGSSTGLQSSKVALQLQASNYSEKSFRPSTGTKSPLPTKKGFVIMPAIFGKKEEERKSTHQYKKVKESSVAGMFLNNLMQPKLYISNPDGIKFMFKAEHIHALCQQVQAIIKEQPMVLRVKAPVKIFGDIHGQYSDLMSFFQLYGAPFENGKDKDIESFDYVFLGDFVDRGINSLETICLLFALKVRYPRQVHLIRGNHEDKWINCSFGFSQQCAMKLGEDPNRPDSVFSRVNQVFEWLPLAAIVEERILCLHGGIGSSLNSIADIQALPRPLEVIHEVSNSEEQLVVDILWSDPTDSDADTGIIQNVMRDPQGTGNIVKFGPDRVRSFLKDNGLQMIVRAHECVMDGFQRFAGGMLMTVFSATDYCGRHKNAGAILIISKDLEIKPKNIYSQSMRGNTWMDDEEQLKKRPPTPPRWKSSSRRE